MVPRPPRTQFFFYRLASQVLMSGGGDVSPVEEDYHREEHRDQRAMDSKHPTAKFSSNILTGVFDDNRSVGSNKSRQPLLARLFFFGNATAKVAAPIGEPTLSGNYPLCDKNWGF